MVGFLGQLARNYDSLGRMSSNHINFNNHGQYHSSNHVNSGNGNNFSNGTSKYQVVDSFDQSKRGSTSTNFTSSQNLDMSVQLTRPTSKTAMLIRQRRAMLEQLSCFLCKGYLIDATTIDECMDSFCKSCIVIYLRSHNNCPKCGILIHRTNPLGSIRSDKVLQDIVYKLVPGLYDDEMKRRRDFYRNLIGASSDEEDDGSCSSFTERNPNLTGEQFGIISHPKPFYKPTDSIDLSIEPQTRNDGHTLYYDIKRPSIVTCFTGNSQQLEQLKDGSLFSVVDSQQFKTFLRCPARFTVVQLKKFIASKFNISQDDTIHLLYLNESLRDEYSLIDVAYIYDWRGIEHMRLFYIIERDLGKSTLRANQLAAQDRKTKAVHSVGTSTQTVKRVCIDPQPKFYEEQNNNDQDSQINTNCRSMRSRTETPATVQVTSGATRAPILRSQGPSKDSDSQTKTTNGISDKQQLEGQTAMGVARTGYMSTASTSIYELNRLRQANQSQPRSACNNSTGLPWAQTNANSNNLTANRNPSYAQIANSGTATISAGNKSQLGDTSAGREIVAMNDGTFRQLIPYVAQGYNAATCVAGPSQSSMVTLASFTEARSNQFVTMSTKTTAGTPAFGNIFASPSPIATNKSQESKSSNQTTPDTPSRNSTPQIAYSFITERGITIVRRLESQDKQTASGSSLPAIKAPNPNTSISGPSPSVQTSRNSTTNGTNSSVANLSIFTGSSQAKTSQQQTPATSTLSMTTSTSYAGSSSQPSPSIIIKRQPAVIATTARHQIKVKPVYKDFVDPTKLKSPNFKKLGYNSKHL